MMALIALVLICCWVVMFQYSDSLSSQLSKIIDVTMKI